MNETVHNKNVMLPVECAYALSWRKRGSIAASRSNPRLRIFEPHGFMISCSIKLLVTGGSQEQGVSLSEEAAGMEAVAAAWPGR